jgi:hypothetical protein
MYTPQRPWSCTTSLKRLQITAVRRAYAAYRHDRWRRTRTDVMCSAGSGGERAKALETYALLSSRLADELGTDPPPETNELHLIILRDRASGDRSWRDAILAPADAVRNSHNAGRMGPAASGAVPARSELVGRAR